MRGTVPVNGWVHLSGSCQNGGGFANGSASLNGWGTLYGRDGRRAGSVRLDGTVFVNQHVSGQHVFINQYANLSGWFTPEN